MSESQNVETAKKGYAAFVEGDVDTALSHYDDDVEFVVPGNSTVSGTYRGKDGVRGLFAKVAEQNFMLEPNRFLADGEVVVVLSIVTAGGESAPEADVFTYRDGKVVNALILGDTAMFERVFGTK
jgi:uncharacterized protein